MKIETIWMLEFFQEIKNIHGKEPRITAWRGPILRSRGKKRPKEIGSDRGFNVEDEKQKIVMSCMPVNKIFDEGSSSPNVKYCRGFCN